jgi:hypothetical protein
MILFWEGHDVLGAKELQCYYCEFEGASAVHPTAWNYHSLSMCLRRWTVQARRKATKAKTKKNKQKKLYKASICFPSVSCQLFIRRPSGSSELCVGRSGK